MNTPMPHRGRAVALAILLALSGFIGTRVPGALGAELDAFGEPLHFLEPLAAASGDPDQFDASLLDDLVVEICRVEESACPAVQRFTSTAGGSDRLRIGSSRRDGSYYIVNWDTQAIRLSPHAYRVSVTVAELELGRIDVGPDRYKSFGRTWPIRFLVENHPMVRVRVLRSRDQSASQVANAIRNEFGLGPDVVADLLASDLEPYSATEIELAIAGVFQPAIVPPTTRVADQATHDALASFDPGSGTMTYSTSTPLLDSLDVGDVLVGEPNGAAPAGFLRRVEAITRPKGGGVVLQTAQASLNETVQRGTLTAAGELQPGDLLAAEAGLPGVTFTAQRTATAGFGALDIGDGYNFRTNIDVTLDGEASGAGVNGTGTVRIQGEIRFNAGYNIGFGVEECVAVPPVCVDRFEAHMGIDQYSDIRVSGDFDGTFDREIVLSTHYFKPIVFFIGPVPVVLVPVVNAVAGVHGDAHLEFSFAGRVTTRLELGAKWTDPDDAGVGWQNLSEIRPPSGEAFDVGLDASMKLRAYAEADAKLLLYGVAGPGFAGRLGVGADVRFPRNPLWFVFGHASADINFQVDLGGILKLAEYSAPLPEVSFTLAEASNQPPACGARTDPIPIAVGEERYLGPRFGGIFDGYFDCADPEGEDIVAYSAVSEGQPVDLSRARWDTQGQRTVMITATDESGTSTTFAITVNVTNAPPILTLASATSTVPASVQYFVTASAFDVESGEPVPCTSLTWSTSAGTLTETLDNRSCTAVIVFDEQGTQTVTVTARDVLGATTTEHLTVTVTAPPSNTAPVLDVNSFTVIAERGPKSFCPDDEPLCDTKYVCPTGLYCDVPFGAVLFNGQVGDYHAPLTLSLEASDPEGTSLQVRWFCSAGSTSAVVTDNGDGTFGCSPWSSSAGVPIIVRAEVSDGVTTVYSEVRRFIMLDRVG